MNTVIVAAIDFVAAFFPSTPENLKIGNIINNLASSMPAVGAGIIREIFGTITTIALLALVIKIYKLLPFKMS